MSKGLVYTTFALLASSLLLLMVIAPVNSPVENNPADATRIGEASYFLESTLSDMDRSLGMATRRALTASTNYVITNGEPLTRPADNISSALVNGSISGQGLDSMDNVSLNSWTGRVADIASRSGYSLKINLTDYEFNSTGFEIKSSYTVQARLKDPVTLASFNRTNTANTTSSVQDLEDPMILLRSKGKYISKYRRCGFDKPAEQLETGSIYNNGVVHGSAEVKPSSISSVSGKSNKILVADDVDAYSKSEVNKFRGAVSAQPNSTSGYTTKYVFDTRDVSSIDQNMSLTLQNDKVWRSNFREMFNDNCYVETDRGPDPLDRMGNQMVSQGGEGLATLVKVSDMPDQLQKQASAVGYVYFNDSSSYGGINKIEGVTGNYSWFRLDQHHVDEWGINSLSY